MKLKYQLRGLGIGLLVTTIILTIANNVKELNAGNDNVPKETASSGSILAFDKDATKAETQPVKEEETESGSIEETSKEASTEKATTKVEPTKEPATEKATTKVEPTKEPATEKVTEKATEKATEKPTVQPPSYAAGTTVTIYIKDVYYASQASEILYNAGVITDRDSFTKFLGDYEYDNVIKEGWYSVKVGDSYENLAKAITRSN